MKCHSECTVNSEWLMRGEIKPGLAFFERFATSWIQIVRSTVPVEKSRGTGMKGGRKEGWCLRHPTIYPLELFFTSEFCLNSRSIMYRALRIDQTTRWSPLSRSSSSFNVNSPALRSPSASNCFRIRDSWKVGTSGRNSGKGLRGQTKGRLSGTCVGHL